MVISNSYVKLPEGKRDLTNLTKRGTCQFKEIKIDQVNLFYIFLGCYSYTFQWFLGGSHPTNRGSVPYLSPGYGITHDKPTFFVGDLALNRVIHH